MAILFIHKNLALVELLENARKELNRYKHHEPVEIVTASNGREAFNQLYSLEDIEVVFIGFDLPGLRDTISSGLVKSFANSGFGFGKKPLIAISLHNNNRLKQAGCNYEADGDGIDFKLLLQQLSLDGYPLREMSRAG